jgi:hypothetical protein
MFRVGEGEGTGVLGARWPRDRVILDLPTLLIARLLSPKAWLRKVGTRAGTPDLTRGHTPLKGRPSAPFRLPMFFANLPCQRAFAVGTARRRMILQPKPRKRTEKKRKKETK